MSGSSIHHLPDTAQMPAQEQILDTIRTTVEGDLSPPEQSATAHQETQDVENSPVARMTTTASEVPYSVFSPQKKRALCAAATCTGLLSPFSTSIYFPSITQVATDLGVSVEKINLTVTTYMIFQGLAPSVWGSFADVLGRRPLYLLTLSIYAVANLALSLQNTYAGLLVLRMVQSAGSSATIAIGAGTIGDITTPSERGFYMGVFSGGVMVAPAIAPVLGGLLSRSADSWKASFWFLFAIGISLVAVLFVWLPETGRAIVGNGSIRASGWNQSLLQKLERKKHPEVDESEVIAIKKPLRLGNPLRCVVMILQKDVATVLAGHAFIYVGYYCITVAFSSQLKTVYNLNTLQIGLCFLPYGVGSSIGSVASGKILNQEFARFAKAAGYGADGGRSVRQNPDFPIEKARLRMGFPMIIVSAVLTVAFGWTFRVNVSYAAPVTILFFLGLSIVGFFTCVQVILVDLYPQESASVTAANNLVRCLLGAGGSAVVDIVVDKIGMGWTFVIVAGMDLLAVPVLFLEYKKGGDWRRERLYKIKAEEDRKKEIEKEDSERRVSDRTADTIENQSIQEAAGIEKN
ncbi:major facilitator superfamily domain-containing protein [Kockiozyma suomiensis]|uniref:major facilitator superfamily domain-containing protein n=1 Tax=Kockiozyma suomiensis TaxID=1337062 RepID=UPI003343C16C